MLCAVPCQVKVVIRITYRRLRPQTHWLMRGLICHLLGIRESARLVTLVAHTINRKTDPTFHRRQGTLDGEFIMRRAHRNVDKANDDVDSVQLDVMPPLNLAERIRPSLHLRRSLSRNMEGRFIHEDKTTNSHVFF